MNPAPPITITRKEDSLAARSRHDESVCNRRESPFQKIAGWKRIRRERKRNGRIVSRTRRRLLSRGAAGAVVAAAAAPNINPQALDLLIQRGKRDEKALCSFRLIPARAL